MGRKSKVQKEQEEREVEEALILLFWLYRTLSDSGKTQQLVKNMEDAGKFLNTSMRILQGKE